MFRVLWSGGWLWAGALAWIPLACGDAASSAPEPALVSASGGRAVVSATTGGRDEPATSASNGGSSELAAGSIGAPELAGNSGAPALAGGAAPELAGGAAPSAGASSAGAAGSSAGEVAGPAEGGHGGQPWGDSGGAGGELAEGGGGNGGEAWDAGAGGGAHGPDVEPLPGVQELALGILHTCARLENGDVKCWGDTVYDQVGATAELIVGDEPGELTDLEPILRGTSQVAAAGYHTCALRDGQVWCWGSNGYGQLGNWEVSSSTPDPVSVELPERVREICVSQVASYALTEAGAVWGWGATLASEESGAHPIPLGEEVTAIACGAGAVCGLNRGGTVACHGQAELSAAAPEPLVIALADRETVPVRQVTVGIRHGCAVYENGAARCWGRGEFGVLLSGTIEDRPGDLSEASPWPAIALGARAVALSSGPNVSCALLEGGRVKCWGRDPGTGNAVGDEPGELGDSLPFVDLGSGLSVRSVVTGGLHACSLFDDGRVKCWGYNQFGQLGIGTPELAKGDEPGEMGDTLPFVPIR